MSLENKVAAVEVAATKAVDLVQSFAEQDPSDASSCWQNPSSMYEQLDQARAEAMEAWKNLEEAQAKDSDNENNNNAPPSMVREEDLRAQFMDMITAAFADVLNDMKEREDIDLDILVDCLQSGLDIMSQEDKEYFMADDAAEEDVLPHEERRRELGFHVHTTA